MTTGPVALQLTSDPAPTLQLRRIKAIRSVEVMEFELEAIVTASEREQLFLTLAAATTGIWPSVLISLLTSFPEKFAAGVIASAVLLVAFLGSVVFAVMWRIERRARLRQLHGLRARLEGPPSQGQP